jgi:hypothetical protein
MAIFLLKAFDHGLTFLVAYGQSIIILEFRKKPDFLSGDSLDCTGGGIQEQRLLFLKQEIVELPFVDTDEGNGEAQTIFLTFFRG